MMRRFTVTLLAATAMGVIACQGASAADLGHPVYKAPPPVPPPVQDWSGIYVGLEGGYGWGNQSINTAFDPFFFGKNSDCGGVVSGCGNNPTLGSVSQSGWLFGGFVGAQKQWGNWVLGIEADFDGADIKGSNTASNANAMLFGNSHDCEGVTTCRVRTVNSTQTINSEIDELGSARAKVGWAFSPNWMLYGTGGLAWAHLKEDNSFSQTYEFCLTPTDCFGTHTVIPNTTGAGGLTMFGWTIGAGLDWKWQIDQGSAWVLGVEYLHYEFPSDTLTLADNQFGTGLALSIDTKERVDVIKGRISYLFSIH